MTSVVVAVYNGEMFLKRQLQSIVDCNPDEVIIADDCSTDNSEKICLEFVSNHKNWSYIKNETNLGYCRNFYNALQKANGDIIFLSDQDDIWNNKKIDEMESVFNENGNISALFCGIKTINQNDFEIETPENVRYTFSQNDGILQKIAVDDMIGCSMVRGCTLAFRKSVVENLPFIELGDLMSHDWLICMSAAANGELFAFRKTLVDYRIHGNNTSLKSGNKAKRIRGIAQSIEGHSYFLNNKECFKNINSKEYDRLTKQLSLEKKRLTYLNNGGFKNAVALIFNICKYKCYYKSFFGGVRVLLGDLLV